MDDDTLLAVLDVAAMSFEMHGDSNLVGDLKLVAARFKELKMNQLPEGPVGKLLRKGEQTKVTEFTDEELLDYLQALTDRADYTGKVILRESTTGRGWRLHEHIGPGAQQDVRGASGEFIKMKSMCVNCKFADPVTMFPHHIKCQHKTYGCTEIDALLMRGNYKFKDECCVGWESNQKKEQKG